MDKNAIKSFAIESRHQMIESVKYQASLIGITSTNISEPISKAEGMETYDFGAGTYTIFDEEISKRKNLVKEINNKGFENVVEEVAYTWFNRIIAIRFMEINDYLPTRTRVLSSETEGKIEPDIITELLDLDLNLSDEDIKYVLRLKDENKLDDLFQFSFIRQCNKLNEMLPGLFEKTEDYMELLLNISFTNETSVVRQLVDTIPEEDFGNQVEIIGWLYQFYNSELKEDTFEDMRKNKVPKERIPSITQIFTPDWVVKYMVENSVGKFWLENYYDADLRSKWKYFIDDAKQDDNINDKLTQIKTISQDIDLKDFKIIDPCMGSGHMLVYIFDVLMQIYVSKGYTEKEASILILENNIYGLDIDDRAYQLAYFAIMMKARSYNRKIFAANIMPSLLSIQESNMFSRSFQDFIRNEFPNISANLDYLIYTFQDAKEFGSILTIKNLDFDEIKQTLYSYSNNSTDLYYLKFKKEFDLLKLLVSQSEILNNTYHVVVTNPPYMASKGMNNKLINYLKINYPLSKRDLFSVFIERCFDFTKDNGFNSIVTMQSWMFVSSFKNFRDAILNNSTIYSLLDLDKGIFDMGFITAAVIFRKCILQNFKGNYNQVLLEDMDDSGFPSQFPVIKNRNNVISSNSFSNIPGHPMAYWVDEDIINVFKNGDSLTDYGETKTGMTTSDNKRFLRLWYEVDINKIGLNYKDLDLTKNGKHKWFPYNKGGSYRKWYGNHEYVVNYEFDGKEVKDYAIQLYKTATKRIVNINYYFKPCISWGIIGGNNISVRYYPEGFIFDVAGMSCFYKENYRNYLLAFLNTKISNILANILNPTFNIQAGDVARLPLIYSDEYFDEINKLVDLNINIVKEDWDFFETSWNFKEHPLLIFNKKTEGENKSLKNIYNCWIDFSIERFKLLKSNEECLNELFINIYNLSDFTPDVLDKDISISLAEKDNDIKSFISYVVGCMFGRYSLDKEGLQFAGGNFDISNYDKYKPDNDNIIPVLDTEYFEDDIVGRFVEFIKICFGEETLEENLDFIASALNKKGKTSREIIRNYFITDFFKDHAKIYKKCPIYWQFDSGKQNAFKCLIYMHRYEPNLVARVRTDYLHKTQKAIEQNLAHCENIIVNSTNKSEISKATKDKSKYIKQLDEIRVYDEVLRHMATQNIEIDLDDGVKVNYAKFQKIEISIEGEKSKKINLLKNI